MIWRLRDLPELKDLAPEHKDKLLRYCAGRLGSLRIVLFAMAYGVAVTIVLFIILGLVAQAVPPPAPRQPGNNRPIFEGWLSDSAVVWSLLVTWLVSSFVLFLFFMVRVRGQVRLAILEYANTFTKMPACFYCMYQFEPPTPNHCPKCGAPTYTE
ncbi:hypothetical protein OT109_02520 [Phycisphaeraceae bacterium D3-23]